MSQGLFQQYVPYSTPIDVAGILGHPGFTTSTNPTFAQVQDIILTQDSFIDRATGKQFRLNHVQDELYDFTGVGPRAGVIILRKYPTISIERVEWFDGIAWHKAVMGQPQDPNTLALPNPGPVETFFWYPEKNRIEFYKLRATRRQAIRISYTWGSAIAPDFIRDLSRNMSAYQVHKYWAGQFNLVEDVSQWRRTMTADIQRLFWQAGTKASGWVG